jgi:ABC-type nitrate/sulfonate/bicarbonate transport system substrate-binding protein
MSQPRTLEAKVIYRSNHSQLAMISIMKHGGIWERLGLDVTRMDLERRALPAEDQLLNGRCNMIFGCHITPHWRVAHDVPMICMAQTVNTAQDMLVSTKPLDGVNDLKDRVLAEQEFCDEEGHLTSHVRGTYELYLRDAGLSCDMLEVKAVDGGNKTQPLLDGKADATFASASQERACQRLGLHTRLLPRYPMVNSITLTSLVPLVQDNPELYIRMIKAIATAIAMVRKDKEKTLEILAGNVAERLGIRDDVELEIFYQRMRNHLEPRLCPKIDSLYNAYRIAELVYPELKEKGNPVKLWDLHYVRLLEAQGFFDELYRE